jgi:hypothetical protein
MPHVTAYVLLMVGCLCGVVFAAGQARAADAATTNSIGINFIGTKAHAKDQSLDADAVAGVTAVAQSNWNNTTITNDDPNGHGNSGTLSTVKDNAGKVIKDAAIAITPVTGSGQWPTDGNSSWGFSGMDEKMHEGGLWPQSKITVTGIPYAKYDVYVYVTAGPNSSTCSAKIAAANGAAGTVDTNATYFCLYNWKGGNYVQATAKTADEAKASTGGNYFLFTGNTVKDVSVSFNGALAGWISVAGIQIVETK